MGKMRLGQTLKNFIIHLIFSYYYWLQKDRDLIKNKAFMEMRTQRVAACPEGLS